MGAGASATTPDAPYLDFGDDAAIVARLAAAINASPGRDFDGLLEQAKRKAEADAAAGVPGGVGPDAAAASTAASTMPSSISASTANENGTLTSKGIEKDAPGRGFADAQATLRAHNRLRAVHGAPPLAWSDACAENAAVAAQRCRERNAMFHNNCKEHGQGQNIFMYASGAGERRSDAAPVHAWYAEVAEPGYPFPMARPTCPAGTGHFTQVVWKATTHVGMAWAGDPKTGVFVVANYAPFGNVQGAFAENVLPPAASEAGGGGGGGGGGGAIIRQAIAQGKSEDEAFAAEQREERRKKERAAGGAESAGDTVVLKGGDGVTEGPELKALLAKIPDFVKSSAPDMVANIVDNAKKKGVTVEVMLTGTGITTVVHEGNSTATSELSWG